MGFSVANVRVPFGYQQTIHTAFQQKVEEVEVKVSKHKLVFFVFYLVHPESVMRLFYFLVSLQLGCSPC
jgi:hypothetical protein